MERKFKRFHHLTYTDRLKIEQMYNGGAGIQEIADALRVNYTTVYRELKRPGVMYDHLNGDYTTDKRYSADIAQQQYEYGKTAKGRPIKLGNDYALADYIERKIADEGRSPAAVLMDIELEGKQFSVRVCEKTIYNYITNGVFLNITNKDLPLHGETKRGYNRVRSASRPPQGREHRTQAGGNKPAGRAVSLGDGHCEGQAKDEEVRADTDGETEPQRDHAAHVRRDHGERGGGAERTGAEVWRAVQ